MVFSSVIFLIYFLPIVLVSYYLFKSKRNYILMIFSLLFYAFGEPVYIVLLLFSSTVDYIISKKLVSTDNNKYRKLLVVASVIVNIGLLSFFKYGDFILININDLFNTSIPLMNLALPIGISFYTFQTLSYTIDVYRRKVKPQKKYTDFLLYISMFPQLIAGPIVRYKDIESQLTIRTVNFSNLEEGSKRFIIGLSKKILLADQLSLLHTQLIEASTSVLGSWLAMIAYGLHIFFDFSGYSDMAIGLCKMFGFDLLENFNFPYIAQSVSDFWRRWHISLGNWFKDYLYFPLGGSRVKVKRLVLNLLIVWTLTGLWHGASWNFLFWGLYFAFFIILEKVIKIKFNIPRFIKHIYTLLVVLFGWVIFAFDNLNEQLLVFKGMFGVGVEFINQEFIFYLKEYALILALGLIFTLPIKLKTKIPYPLTILIHIVLLIVSFSFIVDSTYSPFIYFRF